MHVCLCVCVCVCVCVCARARVCVCDLSHVLVCGELISGSADVDLDRVFEVGRRQALHSLHEARQCPFALLAPDMLY